MSLHNSTNYRPITYTFSSEQRISGSNEDFVGSIVDLPTDIDTVSLVSLAVPRSIFNVSQGLNTFVLDENGSFTTIELTPGNYTRQNLVNALNEKLNTLGNFTYNVSYSSPSSFDTYRLYFKVSSHNNVPVSFVFYDSMFKQVGFSKNSVNQFDTNGELVSLNSINLATPHRIFLKSNLTTENQGVLDSFTSFGSFKQMSMAVHYNHNPDLISRSYNKTIKNGFTFTLTDADNNVVNLNGIPFSITVCFWKRNNTHEIQGVLSSIELRDKLYRIQQEINRIEKEETVQAPSRIGDPGSVGNENVFQELDDNLTYERDFIPIMLEYNEKVGGIDLPYWVAGSEGKEEEEKKEEEKSS